VELAPTDSLFGEASRIAVAEAAVQALRLASTENRAFALASVEGDGPGQDAGKWDKLFSSCYPGGGGGASGSAAATAVAAASSSSKASPSSVKA
jgi:hypothetical protein